MGNLSKKLFRKARSVTPEKARKIADEELGKIKEDFGVQIYSEMLTCLCMYAHNDLKFGKKRLQDLLYGVNEFMTAINDYPGNAMADMRKTLIDECKFDVIVEFGRMGKNDKS